MTMRLSNLSELLPEQAIAELETLIEVSPNEVPTLEQIRRVLLQHEDALLAKQYNVNYIASAIYQTLTSRAAGVSHGG